MFNQDKDKTQFKIKTTINTSMKMGIPFQTKIPTKKQIMLRDCGMAQNSQFYIPTKLDIQLLQTKMPIQFRLQTGLMLYKKQVIYQKSYSFWQIFTSVGVTITGFLCFMIPGVGFVLGGALTSAGIGGLIKTISQPGLSWQQFAKQMGIQAVVGAATSIISKLGTAVSILNNTKFHVAIKGAILGALTGTASQLIRMGFDPNKNFQWSSVLTSVIISIVVSIHQFKQINKAQQKDKFAELKQKLGEHWQDKKQSIKVLDQRWNGCLYRLSEDQKKLFPQLASQQFTIPHNQGLVHFLDYNTVQQLVKQKGGRLPLIAQIINANVLPQKGLINGYLPQITHKMDEIISNIKPDFVQVVANDKFKQVVKNGMNISTVIDKLKNNNKVPYGISKIYFYLPQNAERGVKMITYTDLKSNIQKFSTVMPIRAKDIAKQIKNLNK